VLLAGDLSEAEVIRYTDRFLMFYVRTADRLERTAWWFNKLEGGIEYLRDVVIRDTLGIAVQLDAEMQHIVDTYQDEWRTALEDPLKRRRFASFINTDARDPSIVHVPDRGGKRIADFSEKRELMERLIAAQ